MLCYARSGGTLLNQMLGLLPDTIILSEVSPLGGGSGELGKISCTTPAQQARHWYSIDIEDSDFETEIMDIYVYCRKNKKRLIIRDWSFISFHRHEYNKYNPPFYSLTYEAIKNIAEVKPFAFLRDSHDVWISRGEPRVKRFIKSYAEYLEYIHRLKCHYYKYEDLCDCPETIMRNLCEDIGLQFHINSLAFYKFNNVNGDVQSEENADRHFFNTNIERFMRIPINTPRYISLLLNKRLNRIETKFYERTRKVDFEKILKSAKLCWFHLKQTFLKPHKHDK